MPKRVTLAAPTLVVRFDRQGNLLTRFAAQHGAHQAALDGTESAKADTLPAVFLEQGEIIFRKDGHPDLVAKNVNAQLAHENGQLVLTGTADNVQLGKLTIHGSLDNDGQKITVQLKTESKAHVTQSILDRMPFVPAECWREIQIVAGDTTAELTVRYERKAKYLQYRLDLAPESTKFAITGIHLLAHDGRGKVTVEDNRVHLRGLEAKAFGGALRTEADLDFQGNASKLAFSKIHVQGVNVSELPKSWHIPDQIRKIGAKGKLTGTAKLELTITPRNFTADNAGDLVLLVGASPGLGQWFTPVVRSAVLVGQEVHAQGKGKATVRGAAVGAEPIEFDWQVGPQQVPSR